MTSEHFLDLLLAVPFVWQSTLWLVGGLVLSRSYHANPALSHSILLGSMIGAILSPTATMFTRYWGVGLLPRSVVLVAENWLGSPVGVATHWTDSVNIGLIALGGVTLSCFFIGFIRASLGARRLLRGAARATHWKTKAALASVQRDEIRSRSVDLVERSDLQSPSIWCWSKPAVILLPINLSSQLSGVRLAAVLRHELAHLSRRDHLQNLAADCLVSFIAWQPLAWYARRRLRFAAEVACDVAAADTVMERAEYAETLVQLAGALPPELGLSMIPHPANLSSRVRMILDGAGRGVTIGRRRLGWLVTYVLLIAGMLACMQRAAGVEYRFHSKPDSTSSHGTWIVAADAAAERLPDQWSSDNRTQRVQLGDGSVFHAKGPTLGEVAPSKNRTESDKDNFFVYMPDEERSARSYDDGALSSEQPLRWIGKD